MSDDSFVVWNLTYSAAYKNVKQVKNFQNSLHKSSQRQFIGYLL